MKKRRFIILGFILACTLLLGVGFAALSTTINLTGYMSFNIGEVATDFDEDIELVDRSAQIKAYQTDNTEITGLGGNVLSATVDTGDPDVGTITAKYFSTIGEYAVAKYQIINHGNTNTTATLGIDVNAQTSSEDKSYFTVEKTFAATEDAVSGTPTYDLAPGEICWVTLKITATTLPTVSATGTTSSFDGQINWVVTATAKIEGVE